MTDKESMAKELEELAGKFSEGWHEGIKIDASDIMLLNEAAQALAPPEQEPVAWLDPWTRNNVTTDYDAYGNNGIPLYTAPPQRIEQNFCSRCGKRTKDIHTCTPPRENT